MTINFHLIRALIIVLVLCVAGDISAQVARQVSPPSQDAASSIVLRWKARDGVTRYRLQVARDAKFDDIIVDRPVVGSEYKVTDLTSGEYFWRVAPAAGETGEFSALNTVTLKNGATGVATTNTESPVSANPRESFNLKAISAANSGWRTATGEVLRPVIAPLRSASSLDVVGANADGTIFAIDGVSGIPLWTTRYKPRLLRGEKIDRARLSPLTPFAIKAKDKGVANVVVAFDEGVRLLEGATGREVWRASVPGKIVAGTSVDISRDGQPEVLIATAQPATLKVIEATTGRVIGSTPLPAESIGAIEVLNDEKAGGRVVLALADQSLIIINVQGEIERVIKLDTPLTTAPHFVEKDRTANGKLLLIGVERGLIALDGATLKPLWRVAMEDDAPQGAITTTDFESDGTREAVFVTRRGRVFAINLTDGKIKWSADDAKGAAGVAIADTNGDGILDVLLPAKDDFAIALSGRDGAIVWRAIEVVKNNKPVKDEAAPRQFIIATATGSDRKRSYVVGGDASHVNLRAYQLPR